MLGLFKKDKPEEKSWLVRLGEGLSKSADKISTSITDTFTKRRLDDAALEELEEILITADLGPALAAEITAAFGKQRFGQDVDDAEVRAFLATDIAARLQPVAQPLNVETHKPFVILMVGVNGSGKTTTLGKLAAQFKQAGKNVMLAAGDTFRAAAVEQLQTWGARAGVPVISRETGADAAGLAFEAVERAQREAADVLLIDTAGRLQNKAELMEELKKVVRAIQKVDATAPHATLLVLDATTGQNALSQTQVFREMVNVSGLVVTKLDGTAKGGMVVALATQHKLPIVALGVGEGIEDLQAFDAESFAKALMGA
ncbi:MAG: signal recognition particle-docking protein FtsY [Bdellovibrionales bacterium]